MTMIIIIIIPLSSLLFSLKRKDANLMSGLGSSVGIATELRAGRSGIESRWGRDFTPVQPPVKWVPGLTRGVKCGRGVLLTPF